MTESVGEVFLVSKNPRDGSKPFIIIELEPVDDTLDALSQVYEWRIGERVKVVGNERT